MKGGRKPPPDTPGPISIAQALIRRIRHWKSKRQFTVYLAEERQKRTQMIRELISHQAKAPENISQVDILPGRIVPARLEQYQDAGDWLELRQKFREDARKALRAREGLGTYKTLRTHLVGDKRVATNFETGTVGPSREEIEKFWTEGEPVEFELAKGDGRLAEEQKDLTRDARSLENAEKVMHVGEALQDGPRLEISEDDLADEQRLDAVLQQFVANVEKARKS